MRRRHKELRVWQESMELVSRVYALSAWFPKEELYGLTGQVRRAAVSIPSNIAEGAARGSDREWLKFLNIARGSLSELDTQLEIAKKLDYVADAADVEAQIETCFGLLGGLIASLRRRGE